MFVFPNGHFRKPKDSLGMKDILIVLLFWIWDRQYRDQLLEETRYKSYVSKTSQIYNQHCKTVLDYNLARAVLGVEQQPYLILARRGGYLFISEIWTTFIFCLYLPLSLSEEPCWMLFCEFVYDHRRTAIGLAVWARPAPMSGAIFFFKFFY